ncbi:MAG: flavodoxin family protein, partial [archaeon]|nr:flavodoxin family protein [archaeon]
MSKKILLILGHPDNDSFCSGLADSYQAGAEESGAEIKRLNIGEMKFDPILHQGYKVIQELEPDLMKFQEYFKWADHIVWIYPTWWLCFPAPMKGLMDRAILPGFHFHYHDDGFLWEKYMKGRTASYIITMDSPLIVHKLMFGSPGIRIMKGTMKHIGIKSKKTAFFQMIKFADEKKLKKYL